MSVSVREFAERGADLELVGIQKRFPGFTAIEELDLTIPAGSFFALLGPSGCGKTTTLRLVAGLEEPTRGRILIGGNDVTATKAHRAARQHGVPELCAVPAHVDHRERRVRAEAPPHRRRRGKRARGVAPRRARPPRAAPAAQLSGGQQQRVALARAIVNRPALLLLDEPLGALDLKLRRQMQLELKTIQEEVGLTFLHVTHDQEEAMTMADTVAVMNKGAIEQMGAPARALRASAHGVRRQLPRPVEPVHGPVVGTTDTAITVDVQGTRLVVPTARAARHQGQVTIGVRPEKVALHRDAPAESSSRNLLGPGHVIDVSFSGVSTQYIVSVTGIGTVTVFAQNVGIGPIASEGDEVWISWDVEHGFGLDDDPADAEKFPADDDTHSIAVQRREALVAELEER